MNRIDTRASRLATLPVPNWLARGFASRRVGSPPDLASDLAGALERARGRGEAVFVFVVPDDEELCWDRCELLADWLGGQVELEGCECVCASDEDLARRFGQFERDRATLCYVVATSPERAATTIIGIAASTSRDGARFT